MKNKRIDGYFTTQTINYEEGKSGKRGREELGTICAFCELND